MPHAGDGLGLGDRVDHEVGELASFQVPPQRLDRVELGGVGGKTLDDEPAPLRRRIGAHGSAPVAREAVPDERDLRPGEFTMEFVDEPDQALVVIRAGLAVEQHPRTVSAGCVGERGDHRHALPVKALAQTGVLPLGAQVRRTEGVNETPDSSSKTRNAPLRRAFFLAGASARRSRWQRRRRHVRRRGAPGAPAELPHEAPDVAGVIADPEEGLDHLGDAGKRPQLGRIAVRPAPAAALARALQVGGREPRLASGPTGSA